jgi:hypothetical protein
MVGELIDALVSWETFLVALLVFGFAPGAVLRLIVLAFHRDDPRRNEMLAELHRVPRWERPFWVVEQLEVALSEGIWERVVWAATGRVIYRWHLLSGIKQNRKHPESFQIPDEEEKQAIEPGMLVKLFFDMNGKWAERMWVEVVAVKRRRIVGTVINQPVAIPRLYPGDMVRFKRDHIIDIHSQCACEPAADDPERAPFQLVHSECNRSVEAHGEDPEPPPPESPTT